jgi:hypothetical protein
LVPGELHTGAVAPDVAHFADDFSRLIRPGQTYARGQVDLLLEFEQRPAVREIFDGAGHHLVADADTGANVRLAAAKHAAVERFCGFHDTSTGKVHLSRRNNRVAHRD